MLAAGASGTKPRPFGHGHEDRPEAEQVVPSVAPVAEEQLLAGISRPAPLAPHVAVAVAAAAVVLLERGSRARLRRPGPATQQRLGRRRRRWRHDRR